MPNWTDNDLMVSGPIKEIKWFMEFAAGTKAGASDVQLLTAEKFIPMPEQFKEGPKCVACNYTPPADAHETFRSCPTCGQYMQNGYNRGGYEWCIANWGTKWDLSDVELVSGLEEYAVAHGDPEDDTENAEIAYSFQTAWAPPEPVIEAMGARFPDLFFDLSYYEQGMGFQGKLLVEKGAKTGEWSGNYRGMRGG